MWRSWNVFNFEWRLLSFFFDTTTIRWSSRDGCESGQHHSSRDDLSVEEDVDLDDIGG